MKLISEWIVNIIIFLLLAMVIDMLLPESTMKKYAKLITGLLLMAIIITPIFKIMSTDFEKIIQSVSIDMNSNEETLENLVETKKKEIQASSHAYTLEQMAVQMKTEVEKELMEKYGVEINDIEISSGAEPTIDQWESIIVSVSPVSNAATEVIKPVRINVKDEEEKKDIINDQSMKTLLATEWEVSETLIEIVPREERN